MRILFLTHRHLDYLSDEVLYGLRHLFGEDVVDHPKKEILYRETKGKIRESLVWGHGATAFGLSDRAVDRDDIATKIRTGYFDYIVNSNCWRIHSPVYDNLVVLDGQDHHFLNPTYLGKVVGYFKRELRWNGSDASPIQFSFPDHLQDNAVGEKTQLVHAGFSIYPGIRQEIAANFPPVLFQNWRDYMLDIKKSWFGISPKGAGYDCQRHYEILGNAVLCIYLDRTAPQILKDEFTDGVNCITFGSAGELKNKIDRCKDREMLLHNGRRSLHEKHLSSRRARQLIDAVLKVRNTQRRYHFFSAVQYGYVPYYSQNFVRRIRARLFDKRPEQKENESLS